MAKESCMKFSDYIRVVNPRYSYLKISPHSSDRNYDSVALMQMMCTMYTSIRNRITKLEKGWVYTSPVKCAYYINMYCNDEGKNADFYLVVPFQYQTMAIEKITAVWKKVAVEVVDDIGDPLRGDNRCVYQLKYKKDSAFSLTVDKKENMFLSSTLNVVSVLDKGDSVGILCNFTPITQSGWSRSHRDIMDKIKKGNYTSDTLNISVGSIASGSMKMLYNLLDCIVKALTCMLPVPNGNGGSKISANSVVNDINKSLELNLMELSKYTKNKGNEQVIDTQFIVASSSKDKERARINAESVCQGFNSLRGDNEYVQSRLKERDVSEIDIPNLKLGNVTTNRLSILEGAMHTQVPGKELIEKYGISSNRTIDANVPGEFTNENGYICLGNIPKTNIKTFMSIDKEMANLGYIILGPQGCGKSTFIENYGVSACNNGDSIVVIDYIKACEVCENIANYVEDSSKVLLIDLGKKEYYQSFAFNEAGKYRMMNFDEDGEILETSEIESIILSASKQSKLMVNFIDAMMDEAKGQELSPTMRKGLVAICNIVFLFEDTSLKDVVDSLLIYDKRHEFIDRIPRAYLEEMPELQYDIDRALELDDLDADGEIQGTGTKSKLVDSAMARINVVMEDIIFRQMVYKSPRNNVDFVKAMDEGKAILIKIPEGIFSDKRAKNLITTFFASKVWFAVQLRASRGTDNRRCHLVIDELFQAPNVLPIFEYTLTQMRKFRLKPVFSTHYLNQLGKMSESLELSGASYTFCRGSSVKDFASFGSKTYPYTEEDLASLPRYNAINLVKGGDADDRVPFITQHGLPVNEVYKRNNFKELEKDRRVKLIELMKQDKDELKQRMKNERELKEQAEELRKLIKAQEEEEKALEKEKAKKSTKKVTRKNVK